MKVVYICSPLRGDIERNILRANRYCRFAVTQAAVPIAPHIMFTGFLDDTIPEERQTGLALGMELFGRCDEFWVFGDRLSAGMEAELKAAQQLNIPICYFNDKCERRYA